MKTQISLWIFLLFSFSVFGTTADPMNRTSWENFSAPSGLQQKSISITSNAIYDVVAFVVNEQRSEISLLSGSPNPNASVEIHYNDSQDEIIHFYLSDGTYVWPAQQALSYNSTSQDFTFINYIDPIGGDATGDGSNTTPYKLTLSDAPVVIIEAPENLCGGVTTTEDVFMYVFGRSILADHDGDNMNDPAEFSINSNGTCNYGSGSLPSLELYQVGGDTISTYLEPIQIPGVCVDQEHTIEISYYYYDEMNMQNVIDSSISKTIEIGVYGLIEINSPLDVDVPCWGDEAATIVGGGSGDGYQYTLNGTTTPIIDYSFPLGVGMYNNVVITDSEGCSTTTDINISGPPLLELPNIQQSSLNTSCDTVSISLSAQGGTPNYTYHIENINNNSEFEYSDFDEDTPYEHPFTIDGGYNIWVEDANGCTTDPETLMIDVALPLAIDNLLDLININIPCNGGVTDILIEVSGGDGNYTYEWDDAATQTTATATGLSAGTYNVTVVDGSGCDISKEITINETPAPLVLEVPSYIGTPCEAGGMIDLSFTANGGTGAGYGYSIDGGSSFTPIIPPGTFTESFSSGPHTIILRDNSGCETNDSFTVGAAAAVPLELMLSMNAISIPCDSSSIPVTLNATGGTTPYIYSFIQNGTGDTTVLLNDVFSFTEDEYSIFVEDDNGCVNEQQLTINPPPPSIQIISSSNINTCVGGNSGSIDIEVSGGTGNIMYSWSNNEITQDINGLGTGNYTVQITDDAGCQAESGILEIISVSQLIIDASITDVTCFGSGDGSIEVEPQNGTQPYSYTWTTSSGIPLSSGPNQLQAGIYYLEVADSNNCMSIDTFEIMGGALLPPELEVITNNVGQALPCLGESIEVYATHDVDVDFEWGYSGISELTGDHNEILTIQNIDGTIVLLCTATFTPLSGIGQCTSTDTTTITPAQLPKPDVETKVFLQAGQPWLPYPADSIFIILTEGDLVQFVIDSLPPSAVTYEWQLEFENDVLSNGSEPYYYYNIPGQYGVKLSITDENGCRFDFDTLKTISVEALPERLLVEPGGEETTPLAKMFPNPFVDNFHLEIESEEEDTWDALLINSLKQEVARTQFNTAAGKNQIPLDFSNYQLSNGLYILHISNGTQYQNLRILKTSP